MCTGLAALALAAGGCGGGDGQSPAEAWASDVCSSIDAWADTVAQSKETLSDPSNLSVNGLEDAFSEVQDATEQLVGDLRDLGPPDTQAGDEAKEQISQLSDELANQREVVGNAIGSGAGSLSALLGKAATIAGAVAAMGSAAQTAYDNVVALDGAGELKDAFQSEERCDQMRSTLATLRS
jgi:hypothetical protein